MENPWLKIRNQQDCYFLDSDRRQIDEFNGLVKEDYKIRLELCPQPFIGSIETADVYLLNLNPGFIDDYHAELSSDFIKVSKDSLMCKNDVGFFFFNLCFKNTPAYKWWAKRLREVIDIWGMDGVIKKLMVVELFPYHSKKYKPLKTLLPSQEYQFNIVREAIKKEKKIIIMRSEKAWIKYVPELKSYPHILIKNKRGCWISRGNMPKGKFDEIFKK